MTPKYTNAQITKELRRVWRDNNGVPFTRRHYEAVGSISKTTVENRFGTWTDALDQAGLLDKFEKAWAREARKEELRSRKEAKARKPKTKG